MKRASLGLLALLTLPVMTLPACQEAALPATQTQQQLPLKVYLVRHAEKQKGDDPSLTKAGQARAEALADMLADSGITHIHSSDYNRTRETAAPLAERLGVTVELYDPRDLADMAARLKAAGGRHLVVGHSNTTPQLTTLLGGEGGAPMDDATDYDRLYTVSYKDDGSVVSLQIRYGG